MKTLSMIEDQYRTSDAEKRLSLYLDCPALRASFIAIEMAERRKKKAPSLQPGVAGKIIDKMIDLCPSALRTRLSIR